MKGVSLWLVVVLAVVLQGCLSASNDSDDDTKPPGQKDDGAETGDPGDSPHETVDAGEVAATPRDGAVELEWQDHPEATAYHLYHAAEPGLDVDNYHVFRHGERHENVSSPHRLDGLVNQRYVFVRVTAEVAGEEVQLGDELAVAPAGAQPQPAEIRNLALVNRARQDPGAEAKRYGIALNEDLAADTLSPEPKQPLGFDTVLMKASRAHGDWMLATGNFSHTGDDGSSPTDRARDAGYPVGPWRGVGENLAMRSFTGVALDQDTIDAHHAGLFRSAGHRQNLLNTGHREVGIGHVHGSGFTGEFWMTSMLTQKFGSARDTAYLTGFIHEDDAEDAMYTMGSGRSDVRLAIDGYVWQPFAAGAFSVPLAPGTYELEVYGEAVDGVLVDSITIEDANVQRQVVITTSGARLR